MAKAKAGQDASATGTQPADGGATKTEKKEPKATVSKVFEFVKKPGEGDKLAPQAKLIVAEVEKAGKVTREQLAKNLAANPDFKTRQPVERIITYYQKDLAAKGFIKMSDGAPATPASQPATATA